ncbi:hypothetical protein BV511_07615 [Methylorubrum extorquens]|nr:hypothetical protein BV511_07615 [Methylorubrum extorquens]
MTTTTGLALTVRLPALLDRLALGRGTTELQGDALHEVSIDAGTDQVSNKGRISAHARALQARASATVEATISSAVKWMRPAPAHSLQPARARRMRCELMKPRGGPAGKQVEHQRPFPTR